MDTLPSLVAASSLVWPLEPRFGVHQGEHSLVSHHPADLQMREGQWWLGTRIWCVLHRAFLQQQLTHTRFRRPYSVVTLQTIHGWGTESAPAETLLSF